MKPFDNILTTKDLQAIDQANEERGMVDYQKVLYQDLAKYKDQHGRLKFINDLGYACTWYGYIREIDGDHIIFQDNEYPDKFRIRNIENFEVINF